MVVVLKLLLLLRQMFVDVGDFMTCLMLPSTSTYATGKGLLSDEIHVVVFDRTGDISGFRADTNGERTQSVLETFPFVSRCIR